MIQDETIKKLTQAGTVKIFKAQDYICYEGQPGNEMYVILRGSVGVYTTDGASEKQIELCKLGVEDYFGEMALLDNQPRSASCVALENVVCAGISKSQLQQFIAICPAIAMRVLEDLSLRIRKLSNELYKKGTAAGETASAFEIPAEYALSHNVTEPPYKQEFLKPVSGACPICGETVEVLNVKKLSMTLSDPRRDGRVSYKECDPLWHSIWNCPHCHYSNFYSRFFAISPEEKEAISQSLEREQIPAIEKRPELVTPFDHLVIHYLQAIHNNLGGNSMLLLGRLWLNLYWLFDDARDAAMKKYCAERAAAALAAALESGEISDKESRMTVQLSMVDMYAAIGDKASASAVCNDILASRDHLLLRKLAHELKAQYIL